MMITSGAFQFIPPFSEDQRFENFIEDYFNELDNTMSYSRFGRNGQNQWGLDVYSTEKRTVIQCKLRSIENDKGKIKKDILNELKRDFARFMNYNASFNNVYKRFILASTYAADTEIQQECDKLSLANAHLGICVEYWDWRKLLNNLPDRTHAKYYPQFASVMDDYYYDEDDDYDLAGRKIDFPKSKDTHLIDKITANFEYIYRQMPHVPISFLRKSYPFTLESSSPAFYHNFTLTTSNQELFNLLKSLKFENDSIRFMDRTLVAGVKSAKKKMIRILTLFHRQLIFHIRYRTSNEIVTIGNPSSTPCECVICLMRNFRYEAVVTKLQLPANGLDENLEYAYANFQLGNYMKAVQHFEVAGNLAANQKQPLRHATIQYSLSKMHNHIQNNYWETDRDPALLDRLLKITKKKVLSDKSKSNRQLISWIFDTEFFNSTTERIKQTATKLRDTYYNQLNGGTSTNSYVWELVNLYAELSSFLDLNHIVYNRFLEYKELMESFTEGIVVSLSITSTETSRLKELDEYLVSVLINHANPSTLIKYIYRYELKVFEVSRSPNQLSSIVQEANLFFENVLLQSELVKRHTTELFTAKLTKMLNNILIILSFSNLQREETVDTVNKLVSFLENNCVDDDSIVDNLVLLIQRHGAHFGTKNVKGFLKLYKTSKLYHEYGFLEALMEVISISSPGLRLTEALQDNIIEFEINDCRLCSLPHYYNSLPNIHRITKNKKFQTKIVNAVKLKLETVFDASLYYNAAINDLISPEEQFPQYVAAIESSNSFLDFSDEADREDRKTSRLNDLINLCFKYNLRLSSRQLIKFQSLSNYYNWLLDMKKFDYQKFNPMWTTYYQTIYYHQEFSKYPIIEKKILDEIEKSGNAKMKNVYIKIKMASVKYQKR